MSATLSNLYMIDFDIVVKDYCESIGALYLRYSDDILVICSPELATEVESMITTLIASEKLELSTSKTERTLFDPATISGGDLRCAQYLGFTYHKDGAAIRAGSLSRQWRKMRRAVRRTRKVAAAAIASGKATKVYTKKLRRRFSPLPFRNFSSYARRSAAAFGKTEKITGQVRRFERGFERELYDLQKPFEP